MLENLRITLHYNDSFFLRIEHDTPNGSAISVEAETLTEGLRLLAEKIESTELGDPVWSLSQIKPSFTKEQSA